MRAVAKKIQSLRLLEDYCKLKCKIEKERIELEKKQLKNEPKRYKRPKKNGMQDVNKQ